MAANETMTSSAVIDMEAMDGDESDYETNFAEQPAPGFGSPGVGGQQSGRGQDPEFVDNIKQNMAKNVGSFVWQSGSQKARQYLNLYGNIDILRPYFDVEPRTVRKRLIHSLIPRKPSAQRQTVPRELYGPTMLLFTLIALLLFQMKMGGHTVQEGTLMGSAFGVCFGYWLGVSSFVWFLANICNTHITMLQLLSLIGYALFGHCIVMGLTILIHTSHDHLFFYVIWAIFGGLSTLKMVSILTSRTAGQTQKLIVCGAVAVLHLSFLLYLHFAYHQIVEDLSEMYEKAVPPVPIQDVDKRINVAVADVPDAATKAVQHILRRDTAVSNNTLQHEVVGRNASQAVAAGVQQLNEKLVQTLAPLAKAVAGAAGNATR